MFERAARETGKHRKNKLPLLDLKLSPVGWLILRPSGSYCSSSSS